MDPVGGLEGQLTVEISCLRMPITAADELGASGTWIHRRIVGGWYRPELKPARP